MKTLLKLRAAIAAQPQWLRRPRASAPHAVLRALSLVGFLAWQCAASADDFLWTGKQYIPVPAVLNQDIILVMPEPVKYSFQQPSLVEVKEWDETSLQIRPQVAEQEQRMIMRGTRTGKTYVAKVSSKLPFVPLRTVVDATQTAREERVAAAGTTPLGLLKTMMLPDAIAPNGFEENESTRMLLNMAPFRITAHSVWSSPTMVGVIATLENTIPNTTIQVLPTYIQLRIPEYGPLRVMGADSWELTPDFPTARVYLIFSKAQQ